MSEGLFAGAGATLGGEQKKIAGNGKSKVSKIEEFKKTPLYTVLLNGGLFIAGVVLIQSPIMDMLAPQL
ncbi:hypothetical protein TBLA_0J00870 [Henningerozyma blattae CBS 6284]|uniref:Uncharacterized protein n=1 Tax=Henningerozyma blattae (strain ATCC 34711 / CBS 6284 / DSM 70876 / NBRC 10599 / NRRL Y-10934 / UCD 77-7) TaxID=1071380 RepID=I2H9N3_HENB6|nr:hypothetical protein TBLA_0J00870 [Tetrapisispora blattae CBS 6284]CCH63085.1 hypothetical protein TBLA_0J00870 [Tetrapisispora blattae CBS 6284]